MVPGLLQRTLLASLFALFCAGESIALALEKTVPPPPDYYVLDQPNVLAGTEATALQSLLIEHDRATGEQIVVAIFDSLEDEDRVDFTQRVFRSWQIGKRGKDNGVLVALYWKDRKARIEVGYGLEATLTDARTKRILTEVLVPELKAGQVGRGLTLAAMEILKTLESPLIQNGRAREILKTGGLRYRKAQAAASGGWGVWLFLGLVMVVIAYNMLTSAEAHFTGDGWFRPRRTFRRRAGTRGGGIFDVGWGGGWGSGGGDFGHRSGGGGSFGGFSGGGGSSGGGGASGDW